MVRTFTTRIPRWWQRKPRRYNCDECGRPAGTSFADPGLCEVCEAKQQPGQDTQMESRA